MEDKNNNLLV